jgi:hypothetical protein
VSDYKAGVGPRTISQNDRSETVLAGNATNPRCCAIIGVKDAVDKDRKGLVPTESLANLLLNLPAGNQYLHFDATHSFFERVLVASLKM